MLLLILLKGHYEINKIIIITNTELISCRRLVKLLLSSSQLLSGKRLILVTFEYSMYFVDAARSAAKRMLLVLK